MSADADADPRERVVDGLFVRCFGAETAPAVLMSAGLGGSGAYWQPQVAALARDHHVILYDHRGTGRSDRAALPTPYDAGDLARDMVAVLDGLGIAAAHLVGHAAGAIAALQLALDAPARAASLTLVNAWAVADPHFVRCFEIRREILLASGPAAYLKAQPLFLYPASWISDHLRELDVERAAHASSFQAVETLFARMTALQQFDVRDRLAGIAAPVLVVAADDDMLVPAAASIALAAGLPRATLKRFGWGGHAINVTDAAGFDGVLLGFLAQHRDAPTIKET